MNDRVDENAVGVIKILPTLSLPLITCILCIHHNISYELELHVYRYKRTVVTLVTLEYTIAMSEVDIRDKY